MVISAACRPAAGVSAPCRGPSHFSLFGQRKVTKREATPMARPPGILPCGCAGGLRGFSTAHPCAAEKLARIPASHPSDFPPPTRHAIGAPEEQRASCAHFSEKPQPRQRPVRRRQSAGLMLSPFRRAAAIRVRAGCALLCQGPLGRGRWMEDQPAGWPTGCRPVFRQHRMCCRKTPESTRAPAGQDARRARPRGAFSLGYFSLGKQREVTRPPAGGRNALSKRAEEPSA
jgi:hypothetical protein